MSVVLVFGIMGCAASSAVGLAYTCTEGSFDFSNINSNACFSFFSTDCEDPSPCPPCVPDPEPIWCQYIDVKQTTANTFVLSDITVVGGDTGLTNLVRNMTPPTSIVGVSNSQLIDIEPEDGDPTDAGATSSFTLDLGRVVKVHSVTLTNTVDTTRQADVCGAKITLRRPLYQAESSGSTDARLDESPIIDYVADSYTYNAGDTTWG